MATNQELFDRCRTIQGSLKDGVVFYDNGWARDYEKDMLVVGMTPQRRFWNLCGNVPDKNAKIIDVAAGKPMCVCFWMSSNVIIVFLGTGILGTILKGAGYENLEALDGSKEMLKIAEEKKIYKKVSAGSRLPIELGCHYTARPSAFSVIRRKCDFAFPQNPSW